MSYTHLVHFLQGPHRSSSTFFWVGASGQAIHTWVGASGQAIHIAILLARSELNNEVEGKESFNPLDNSMFWFSHAEKSAQGMVISFHHKFLPKKVFDSHQLPVSDTVVTFGLPKCLVCDFHIVFHLLCWASGGGAINSPSHVLYMGVSYSR